jgi:hypothetical protein
MDVELAGAILISLPPQPVRANATALEIINLFIDMETPDKFCIKI